LQDFDADVGVADLLDDFQQAQYAAGHTEEEMEKTAKAFYDMMSSTQKPLHDRTMVSQLDAIGRVMGFKS
jgi:lysyl-tRNA synthetase class I